MDKFTWKMRNELKRMKNQFSDFYILSYGRFCTQKSSKNVLILSTKTTISQKIKIATIGKLIFDFFFHLTIHLAIIFHLAIQKNLVGALLPTPPTGPAPLYPACFWIDWLVSVWIRIAKISSVFCIHVVTYIKIDYTSKTKRRTKKISWTKKSFSEQSASFLYILTLLNNFF